MKVKFNDIDNSTLENMYFESQSLITLPFKRTEPQYMGTPYSFNFRPGEVTVWSGQTGSGKSLLIGQIALSLIDQKQKVCFASLEVLPEVTLKRMATQVIIGQEKDITPETIDSFTSKVAGKLSFYSERESFRPNNIFNAIQFSIDQYGSNHFFIDSMPFCVSMDDYGSQWELMSDLSGLAVKHNIHIHVVVPMKENIRGTDINDVFDTDNIRGSGVISDIAHNVFMLTKNKAKFKAWENGISVDDSKPDYILGLVKQRCGPWQGYIPLWFERFSLTFCETNDRIPPTKYF